MGGTGCNPVRAQRTGGLSYNERRRAIPPNSSFQNMRIAFKPDAPNSVTSCCLTTTPDYIRGHPRIVDSHKIAGGTGCIPVRAQRTGGLSYNERRRAMPPTSTFQKMRIAFRPASLLQQNRLLTIRSHGNNLHRFADDFFDRFDVGNRIFRQIFHATHAGNVFLPACNGPIHGF
ncbi:hypothetical protein Pan161_21820 [Gimesia algae]|uniref:Uncharacterized protein n=1 Tax=Gimesia algae TaxID=2527971 RepID=A0A517VC19_9PLAN|nr:hypothetical protein Pan161_21820 [Gimesia algae]